MSDRTQRIAELEHEVFLLKLVKDNLENRVVQLEMENIEFIHKISLLAPEPPKLPKTKCPIFDKHCQAFHNCDGEACNPKDPCALKGTSCQRYFGCDGHYCKTSKRKNLKDRVEILEKKYEALKRPYPWCAPGY